MNTTVSQFLALGELSNEKLTGLANSPDLAPLREKMSKELKGMPIPESFFEEIVKQLSELLNIDVRAILLSVWSKSDEFQKYLDAQDYPPDETVLVPLAEHTIISEHNPSLKSFVNKIPLGKIAFHIYLELVIKGAVARIKDGRLMGGTIGSCTGKGSITFGDMYLLEKESQPFDLPGSIELAEGIAIKDATEGLDSILSRILQMEREQDQ